MTEVEKIINNYFGLKQAPEKIKDDKRSITWLCDELVVQARPLDFLPYAQILISLSREINLPGLNYQDYFLVKDDRVWTAQKRIQDCWSLIKEEQDLEATMVDQILGYAAVTAEQLDLLAREAPLDQIKQLPPSKSTKLQLLSLNQLQVWSQKVCPLADNPAGKISNDVRLSQEVFAHGDPIAKNILIQNGVPILIDFEAIAALPRERDFSHAAAFLLKHSQLDLWPKIINGYWQVAQTRLKDWQQNDWYNAVAIYLLRELLAFPNKKEQTNYRSWTGLNKLIAGELT